MKAVDDEQLAAFRARVRDRLGDLGRPHGFAAAEVFALITDLCSRRRGDGAASARPRARSAVATRLSAVPAVFFAGGLLRGGLLRRSLLAPASGRVFRRRLLRRRPSSPAAFFAAAFLAGAFFAAAFFAAAFFAGGLLRRRLLRRRPSSPAPSWPAPSWPEPSSPRSSSPAVFFAAIGVTSSRVELWSSAWSSP